MKPSLDRTLKLLWLAIGALLLLLIVGGGVMILAQVIGNAGAGSEAQRVASGGEPSPAKEAALVRYGMPHSILGTATRIVRMEDGPAQGRRASYESGYGGYGEPESSVNVMFVDEGGVRLLLDRPAFIRDVSFPGEQEKDAPREWISYVLALDDTDRNGKLDARDAMALYVTDLDGRNLRPVLTPPLRYRSHAAFGPGRILVYALQGAGNDEARMRQRAFLYDTRTNRLAPYAALDSAAEQAGRILQR